MKKYTAMSVWLPVKDELRAANGNKQFTICVKAPTKKRVAELLAFYGQTPSVASLNERHGLFLNETYSFTPPEDETIYFRNEHMHTPNFQEWLKLDDWRR